MARSRASIPGEGDGHGGVDKRARGSPARSGRSSPPNWRGHTRRVPASASSPRPTAARMALSTGCSSSRRCRCADAAGRRAARPRGSSRPEPTADLKPEHSGRAGRRAVWFVDRRAESGRVCAATSPFAADGSDRQAPDPSLIESGLCRLVRAGCGIRRASAAGWPECDHRPHPARSRRARVRGDRRARHIDDDRARYRRLGSDHAAATGREHRRHDARPASTTKIAPNAE